MGVVLNMWDRLTNVLSGQGTSIDKRSHGFHTFIPCTHEQAEAAYRSDGLVRKIIDIPPFDMTRARRDWQADSSDIEAVEKEERRIQLWPKLQRALVLARLYGGGALVLGTNDTNTEQPLDPERVQKEGLRYIHVMSRHQLSEGGEQRLDPQDEWFGHPTYFSITANGGRTVRIHPSRVIAFVGQKVPEGALYSNGSWFWGDPLLQSIGEAVNNAGLAQGGFAALIDEAKLTVVKFKDLTSLVATAEGDQTMLNRLAAMGAGKSTWRVIAADMEDDVSFRETSWGGIPDVMFAFLQILSGVADIPVTRLLGTSPKGLQSTGDGEERDYHAMVMAKQNELLAPALDRIDPLLLRSALGSAPEDIYYEFAPLQQISEKDAAEIEFKASQTVKNYVDTGVLPEVALGKIASNRMIETGRWPGSEAAFEEHREELENPEEEQDETLLLPRPEQVRLLEKRKAITAEQADRLITDASPRSLYVSRKVQNVGDIKAWAKAQGITDVQDDLHVTIIYSETPVDWMKAGNASEWGDKDGKLTIPPGGPRAVEPLGDKSAVLMFASSELTWRHRSIVEAGANHSYDDYIPHISLTEVDIDLSQVEPYRGKIVLGPEVFEETKSEVA